jgi:cupin fold WbuC family metalloprotein
MKLRELSNDVLVIDDPIVQIQQADLSELRERLCRSKSGRVRFSAHPGVDDTLHEMLILLQKGNYVRPHSHPGKSESFHIIDGQVDVIVFDETGQITQLIRMGDYQSGKTFYYRLNKPLFHTVLVRSQTALFHETTNGPFSKGETVFPPWAPPENSGEAAAYLRQLEEKLNDFMKKMPEPS